ncbi:metallophosphoesterase family protein [Actinoalloteichus spitiensis]|uniref:metallophosphoesterase family protein n=1 Tax=Actinoalloteichus spitiensis TaxID=252394 RepID=UPI00047463D3|nr:metallophosphoesterase [Actinoalloteichus spitiensis]
MVRVLAVADGVVEKLWTEQVRAYDVALVLGAGDLPFDYLEYLSTELGVPCVFVPGNHDQDLSGYTKVRGMWTRGGMPVSWPGPAGAVNADGRVVDVAGLRIAGLGGCLRYREGANQWTEREQARRGRRVCRRAAARRWWDGRGVDVLLTHAPPFGCGDLDDPPHRGFHCLHDVVRRLRPPLLVHGHVHPEYGPRAREGHLGNTLLVNAAYHRVVEIPVP